NILMQDEGVGVRAVEWLQAHYVIPDVDMIDGGTMGLDLLHYLQGPEHLLILDAVEAGKPPGEIIALTGDAVPAFLGMKLSPHQIGVQELLATAQLMGYTPPEVVILGVQPARLKVGLELSPVVAAQVEPLARRALAQLAAWGYQPQPLQATIAS
ncbi:MAG: hydrogenase maturation protease, partial [Caldilineae bacterium]